METVLKINIKNQVLPLIKSFSPWAIGLALNSLAVSALALSPEKAKDWQEDLHVYRTALAQKHIDAFHQLPESEMDAYLSKLSSSLLVLTQEQLWVELMRLTQRIGDGHTSVPLWQQETQNFPFEVKILQNRAYITATTTEYKSLLGSELLSINGEDVAAVIKAVSVLVPFSENAYSNAVRTGQYLLNAQVLMGLGVIAGGSELTLGFQTENKKVYVQSQAVKSPQFSHRLTMSMLEPIKVIEKENDDLWFGSPDKGRTAYVKLHRYPSYGDMEDFADELLEYINKQKTKNLVIDLRGNYGGDFFVGLKLAHRLVLADSIDWKHGVYTLIDNETFSAAMSNAAQFQQLLNAKLVGQATGAKPSGYQDMGQFRLPNSGLVVTYSKRLYHFQKTAAPAVFPDVPIALTIDDYRKGQDRSLNWVWSDIKRREKSAKR